MRSGGDSTINDQATIQADTVPPSALELTFAAAETLATLDVSQNGDDAYGLKAAYETAFAGWQERLQSGQFDSSRAILEDLWEKDENGRQGIAILCGYHSAWKGEEYMPPDLSSPLALYGGGQLTVADLVMEEEHPDPAAFQERLQVVAVNGSGEERIEVSALAGVFQTSPFYEDEMSELLDVEFLERGAFVTIRDNLRGFTSPENILITLTGYGLARLTTKMILARIFPSGVTKLGSAARAGAAALESVVESGAFNFFTRALTDLIPGRDVDWSPYAFARDWASLAICFGALRMVRIPTTSLRSSMSQTRLFNPTGAQPVTIAGRNVPVLNSTGENVFRIVENLSQTTAFYLGDKVAYVFNLNDKPSTFLEDWLTLLQFGAAIKITDRLSNSWLNRTVYGIQKNASSEAATVPEIGAAGEGVTFESAVSQYEAARNSPERAALHERIINELLMQGESSENPQLIFTAGPFGAGKSTVIDALVEAGYIDTQRFMRIDPDQMKEMIPEYGELKTLNTTEAATVVHPETGDLQETAFFHALDMNKNMIVDGSLRHTAYFSEVIRRIRTEHPNYDISIIYVDASEPTLLQRVVDRGIETGRHIPEDLVIKCKEQVRFAVEQLKHLVDSHVAITNENFPYIQSSFRDGETTPLNFMIPMRGSEAGINYPWAVISQFSDEPEDSPEARETTAQVVLDGLTKIYRFFAS